MIDTTLLGETAAKCMDSLDNLNDPDLEDGALIACAIVCVVRDKEDSISFTRTYCSDDIHYRQVGIMAAGLNVVTNGSKPDDVEDD